MRAREAAQHRLIEPLAAFRDVPGSKASILASAEVNELPSVMLSRGEGNTVLAGFQSSAKRLKLSFFGRNCTVFIGPHAQVGGDFQITGSDTLVYIGAFTTISSLNLTQWGDGGSFFIGDCGMLSARIQAGNTDSHAIFDLSTGRRINPDRDVFIDDHVWIARDVRIAKGTRIGRDTVIGQGSLVSGRVDGNAVYAGIPARKIREGTNWSRYAGASVEEVEACAKHQGFLRRLASLRARIASLEGPVDRPAPDRMPDKVSEEAYA